MAVHLEMAEAQFENVNALRKYPFSDESSLVDVKGRTAPDDVVVDVRLAVPHVQGSVVSARMTSLHVSRHMVSVCFVADSAGRSCALSATVSESTFKPYMPYRLEKVGGTVDAGGIVTFGNFGMDLLPETYFFRKAFVHPCCVAKMESPGLRSFFDPRSGDRVSGDAAIDFSGYVNVTRDGKSFRLQLDEGADAELASECAMQSGMSACGATPIRSINGIRPDEDGNIVLWFH